MPKGDQGDDFEVDAEVEDLGAGPEVEDAEASAEVRIKKLRNELAQVKKEKQENMDGWQRAKADYVNLLKRSEVDAKNAKEAGVTKAVEALLPAYDAIERAKEHLPRLGSDKAGGDIPEGFLAIIKQLEAGFASLGLVAVGEVGEAFDPSLHEAYGQDTVEDKAQDDTVTAVLEKGWKQGDRVIRPAKVRVAHYQ